MIIAFYNLPQVFYSLEIYITSIIAASKLHSHDSSIVSPYDVGVG